LPQYEDKYVFIAECAGLSLNALNKWADAFIPGQDTAQLIAYRIQTRFQTYGTIPPEQDYGRFYENTVRIAADAKYSGARREEDCWIMKQYPGEGDVPEENEYVFLVLVTVDRQSLREQLESVLAAAAKDIDLTKDQNSAVTRFRLAFFDGF
jgi:hypothetical protein